LNARQLPNAQRRRQQLRHRSSRILFDRALSAALNNSQSVKARHRWLASWLRDSSQKFQRVFPSTARSDKAHVKKGPTSFDGLNESVRAFGSKYDCKQKLRLSLK